MRLKIIIIILLFVFMDKSLSQNHQLGLSMGVSNYIGDVGNTNFVWPNSFALGVYYSYIIANYTYLRANAYFSNIRANDIESNENYRMDRNKNFNTPLFEISFGMEHNFFKYNFNKIYNHTPYLFFGLGFVGMGKPAYVAQHKYKLDYRGNVKLPLDKEDFNSFYLRKSDFDYTFSIPFGFGYKMVIKRRWNISLELGFRYSFTDNIDANVSRIKEIVIEKGLNQTPFLDVIDKRNKSYSNKFGNLNTNDWYVFSLVTLTYSFGKYICPCWD